MSNIVTIEHTQGGLISAQKISSKYRESIKEFIMRLTTGSVPTLVGFLANDDHAAKVYARWTKSACEKDGIKFILRRVDKMELESNIYETNKDPSVHGIMIYYPVFGNEKSFYSTSMDDYLRDCIIPEKDIEGLCFAHRSKLYRNIRFMDPPHNTRKAILPCTPLAVIKVLKYLNVYCSDGKSLSAKTITVINRSEIVGRPLAAMFANDGADVYSIDLDSIYLVTEFEKKLSKATTEEACRASQIIVTGVPTKSYRVPTEWIQPNTIVINISSFKNIDKEAVLEIPGVRYVPLVGKVTVAMLERNLLQCYDYAVASDSKTYE